MDSLVASIREVFDHSDRINTNDFKQLLESYKSHPADWQRYAHFDPHKYTRNLVDTGNGKYNLLLLCWGPGMGSSVHDHTNSNCFVKVLAGSLLETRYSWPSGDQATRGEKAEEEEMPLLETGRDLYSTNGVAYMSDEIGLHRMENSSHSDPTVTLHCYIPPFEHCQVFDQRTGKSSKATVTFYTKYGEKVDYSGSKEGRVTGATETPGIVVAPFGAG